MDNNIQNINSNSFKDFFAAGKFQNDINKLNSISSDSAKSANDMLSDKKQKLKDVSKEFESIFVKMMMDQMRKTIDKSELIDSGNSQEIFEGMFDDEISKQISKNGNLGIANALYNQMEKLLGSQNTDNTNGRVKL